jgi:hypothetical protein
VQGTPVMPGDSRRARIEKKMRLVIELAYLLVPEFVDDVAAPERQVTAADTI